MGGMSKRRRRLAGDLARFRRNYGKRTGERRASPGPPDDHRFDHKFDKKLRSLDPIEFYELQSGDGLDEPEEPLGQSAED